MTTDEIKEQCAALLTTVRHLMTGAEIEACEWTKSDEFEDEVGAIDMYDEAEPDAEPLESDYEDTNVFKRDRSYWMNEEADRKLSYINAKRLPLIGSLSIQFSREIGEHFNVRKEVKP